MKTRARKNVLTLAGILIVAFIAFISLRSSSLPPEPTYQGKTIDQWLDTAITNQFLTPQCMDALQQFGPAAVPLIFRKLEQNDSPWRDTYRDFFPKLPAVLQKHLPKPGRITFRPLYAGWALDNCGTKAAPLIIARLRDHNPAVREAAWQAVPNPRYQAASANQIISLCVPALRDSDAMVRLRAAMLIGDVGPSASNLVPDLIPLLSSPEAGREKFEHVYVHANTALALGEMGPSAAAAVPALTALMNGTNSYESVCAAIALWHITSNAAPSFTILTNELATFGSNSKNLPIKCLGEMGAQAKPAFPLVLAELPNAGDPYQRGVISNALIAIDPQAAAQFFSTNAPANPK